MNLPDEIFRLILNMVALPQVLTIVRRTCKRFRSLIDSKGFIGHYRLLYFKYQHQLETNSAKFNVEAIVSSAKEFDSRSDFFHHVGQAFEPIMLLKALPTIHFDKSQVCTVNNQLVNQLINSIKGCNSSVSMCLACVLIVYAGNNRMSDCEKLQYLLQIAKNVIRANILWRIDLCDLMYLILVNLGNGEPYQSIKIVLRTVLRKLESPFMLPNSNSYLTEEQKQIVDYSMEGKEVCCHCSLS